MGNDDNSSENIASKIELARLELEEYRVKLERSKVEYERWRLNVGAAETQIIEAAKATVTWGQSAIRNLFLLNGGALVALPTLREILDAAIPEWAMLVSLIAFTCGLILTAAASLIAFLAQEADTAAVHGLRELRGLEHNKLVEGEKTTVNEEQLKSATERIDRHRVHFKTFRNCGVICAIFAWVAFCVGAGISTVGVIRSGPPAAVERPS